MRRLLRVTSLLVLVLALATTVMGLHVAREQQLALVDQPADVPVAGRIALAHGLLGHAAVAVALVAASGALLLGLHHLLGAGGSRGAGAALALLGPALLGLGLTAEATGLRDWRLAGPTVAAAEHESFVRSHALVPGLGFLAAAAALAALARVGAAADAPGDAGEDEAPEGARREARPARPSSAPPSRGR